MEQRASVPRSMAIALVLAVAAPVAVVAEPAMAAPSVDRRVAVAPVPAEWSADDRLRIDRYEVDPLGDPVAVHVSWPDPAQPVDTFQLRRGSTVVATLGADARAAVDNTVGATGLQQFQYTLIALAGTTVIDEIGPMGVVFPTGTLGCTMAWTGATSSSWHNPSNWASIGIGAGVAGVPTSDDNVCATITNNWPITVDEPGAVAGSITGTLPDHVATLRVATGGDLVVGAGADVYSIEMAGGDLTLTEDSSVRWTSYQASLVLGGGTLTLGGTLRGIHLDLADLGGYVEVVPDTTTTIDGGRIEMESLRFDDQADKSVIGRNGHVMHVYSARISGTTNFEVGPGGARLETSAVATYGDVSTTTFGWTLARRVAPDEQNLRFEGVVTVADHAELDAAIDPETGSPDTELDNVTVDLDGDVTFTESLTVMPSLDVTEGGTMRSGANPTPFAELVDIADLSLHPNASVAIAGDLTTTRISVVRGAMLDVGGTIIDPLADEPNPEQGFWARIDGATVRTGNPWQISPTGSLSIGENVTLDGDVVVHGYLWADAAFDETGSANAQVTGDLRLSPSSTTSVGAISTAVGDFTEIDVAGALTLDGLLAVTTGAGLPAQFELNLLRSAATPFGAFDGIDRFGAAADRVAVEQRGDGVYLVGDDDVVDGWQPSDATQVTSAVIDDDGLPVEVGLEWPAPVGSIIEQQVVRTVLGVDTVVATLSGDTTVFWDADPLPLSAYTIRASIAGQWHTLSAVTVVFPARLDCTLLWTGDRNNVDTDWFDARHWAPFGTADSSSISDGPRVPALTDHVCINAGSPSGLIIVDIGRPGAVAAAISGDLVSVSVNRMANDSTASLSVGGDVELSNFSVLDGASIGVDGDVRANFVGAYGGDASLVVNGTIDVAGVVESQPQRAVFIDGSVTSWGFTVPSEASLELEGAVSITGEMTVDGEIVVDATANGTIAELTTGASTLWSIEVDHPTVPHLTVGEAEVAGDVTIDLVQPLPDPSTFLLVETANSAGDGPAMITVTGETAGARATFGPDGIGVVRSSIAWANDDRLQVTGLTVDGDGLPIAVGLSWPLPTGAVSQFEIVRTALGGDTVIATLVGTSTAFTDDDPFADAIYTVRAGSGSQTNELRPARALFPADLTCSLVWTAGAHDESPVGRWFDVANWAPHGLVGSPSLAAGPRPPAATDHVCIDTGLSTRLAIVDVSAPLAVAASISGEYAYVAVNRNAGDPAASLAVTGDVELSRLAVFGGATVGVLGDVTANLVGVQRDAARLTVDGTITVGGVADNRAPLAQIDDGSVSSSGFIVPAGATLDLDRTAVIRGPLLVDGAVLIRPTANASLEELTTSATTTWTIQVDQPSAVPRVVVVDLTVAGTVNVVLQQALADPSVLNLVQTPRPAAGSPSSLQATGAFAGSWVTFDATGIGVVRSTPGWPTDANVYATAVTVDNDGLMIDVALAWPATIGVASRLDIVRTALGVDAVIGSVVPGATSFVDTDPLPSARYTVRAYAGATLAASLGEAHVVFPSALGCTILWTGAADPGPGADWRDALNWVPYGTERSASLDAGMRVPNADDHACIDTGTANARTSVALTGLTTLTAISGNPFSQLDVTNGAVVVTGDLVVGRLTALSLSSIEAIGDLMVDFFVLNTTSSIIVGGDLIQSVPGVGPSDQQYLRGASIYQGSVTVAGNWIVPIDATVLAEQASIAGDVSFDGTLSIASTADVEMQMASTFSESGSLSIVVDPASPPRLVARSSMTFGGTLKVTMLAAVQPGDDLHIVQPGSANALTGAFAVSTLSGEADGAELVVDDTGVHVVATDVGGGGGCDPVPAAAGLAVGGCWRDDGTGVYTTDPSLIEEPADTPSIGGVILTPGADTTITLDLGANPPTLTSDGDVATAIDVQLPSRIGRWQTGTASLGWTLDGQPIALATNRFFGTGLADAATISRVGPLASGMWQLDIDVPLPGILGGGTAAIASTIDSVTGHLANPVGQISQLVVAALGQVTNIGVTYADLNRWQFAGAATGTTTSLTGTVTLGLTGPTTGSVTLGGVSLGGIADFGATLYQFSGISSTWVADLDGANGTRQARLIENGSGGLTAGSFIEFGAINVGVVRVPGPNRLARTTQGWSLAAPPVVGALLQAFDLTVTAGRLTAGQLRLGDVGPGNSVSPSIADIGNWLPIGGLTLGYNAASDVWSAGGFLDQPDVQFSGTLDFDNGELTGGSLNIPNVHLGALASLDLQLVVTGVSTMSISGRLHGPAFAAAPQVSGSLSFGANGLSTGTLVLSELPIGDLLLIDDLRLIFVGSLDRWALGGSLISATASGPATQVAGSATFTNGVLTAASLLLEHVVIGPATVEELKFDLLRDARSGPRDGVFQISGKVRGPAVENRSDPISTLRPITGSAQLLDGQLSAFGANIPSLELAGLGYLSDLAVSYSQTGATGQLSGTGTLRSATDDAGGSPTSASFSATTDHGAITSMTVAADPLPLGGLLTIDDFVASYDAATEPTTCHGLPVRTDAAIYAIAGTVRGSAVSGCLAIAGRRLVGIQIDIASLRFGDLLVIESFQARALSFSEIDVAQVGGSEPTAVVQRTSLSVSGTVRAGTAASALTGSIELRDGGLASVALAASTVALSATVQLTNLSMSLNVGDRFDGVPARTMSLSGQARHDGGVTSASGSLVFAAGGALTSAFVDIGNLPLGPIVLEDFGFDYSSASSVTTWAVSATVVAPDDPLVSVAVSGTATFTNGRLTAADVIVPSFSVGELALLTGARFQFSRNSDGSERWAGNAGVGGLGHAADPSSASFEIVIGTDRRFRSGSITVGHVRLGGLLHLTDLAFSGSRRAGGNTEWAVSAQLTVGDRSATAVSGSLTLSDGRATAGSLSLSGLSIAELATIQSLTLTAHDVAGVTVWAAAASVAVGEGSPIAGSGSFVFERGRLAAAELQLGAVPIGEMFRIDNLRITFAQGVRWSASGSVTDEDGTATFAGTLDFVDGQVAAGSLQLTNLQVGPLELSELTLQVGTNGIPGATVCGVVDTTGPGVRYVVTATVRSRDNDLASLAGRLRLDNGNFAAGVLCGDDIKIADFVVLDDVQLAYSNTIGANGRTIAFSGAATVADPNDPSNTASASVSFSMRDRRLQQLAVQVASVELGDMLLLEDLSVGFDRDAHTSNWNVSATIDQDGTDSTLVGTLTVNDGTIVAGSLSAARIRFGDLFTLDQLALTYHGRITAAAATGGIAAGTNSTCSATPNDNNVPSGPSGSSGSFSRFTAAASITANGDTYAARGQLVFGDGDLAAFDITLACMPIGDFKTLEAVRIAKRPGQLSFAGRLKDDDGTSAASGSFVFADGRLVGGQIEMQEVPFGPIQIHRLRVAIGATASGNTEYALTVVLDDGDNPPAGAGGSLIMNDGRVVAGSLSLDGIKLFDMFRIDQLDLSIDGSVAGRTRFTAGTAISVPPGGGRSGSLIGGGPDVGGGTAGGPSAEVQVSVTLVDGRVTAGSFTLGAAKLFDAVPLGRVSVSFDGAEQRWAAELNLQIGQNGPGFVVGAEFERGRFLSGAIGFDFNGDGQPDGAPGVTPPADGNANLSWFPLKAMYLVYCSSQATASYCPGGGVSLWAGRLGIQLPTDLAPGIEVEIEVRDGVLVHAWGWIDFGFGILVYPAVFLESIGLGFGVKPFHASGSIGLAIGVGAVDIADIEGWVSAGEGPPLEPDESPDDYEPDYIYFASGGSVSLFELPIGGEFASVFQSNGYVGFGGSIGIRIVEDILAIEGGVEGALFNASGQGFNLTHPETGARLTGWHAQIHGYVSASVLGFNVGSAHGHLNTIGAHAYGEIPLLGCVGVGIYWSTGNFRETCDVGQYAVAGVNVSDNPHIMTSGVERAQGRPLLDAAAPTYQSSEFDVAAGEELLSVRVTGYGSGLDPDAPAPDVILVDPNGVVYDLDDNDPNDATLVATGPNARWFLIGSPPTGRYRVLASATSIAIEEVALSRRLPDVDVGGTVTADGDEIVLDYALTEIPGQQVLFVERNVAGTDRFENAIGTAEGTNGSIRFTPAGGRSGGPRELIATVIQDGFTRTEVVVATFDVGEGRPAGEPGSVAVAEIAAGARVTWVPPVDDGGRRITSYRIYSDAGWGVTADADQRSVEVPIPRMEPGKTVTVYVEARTGLGWGYSSEAAFTATQRTGPQYGQSAVPSTDRPGLGGGLVAITPGPDPEPPTTPTVPDPTVLDPTVLDPIGPDPIEPILSIEPTVPTSPPPLVQPGGQLPRTGSSSMDITWLALVLIISGTMVVRGRRRPRVE